MDNRDDDPIDRLLREAAGNPTPSPADRDRAREVLYRAVTAATVTPPRRPAKQAWAAAAGIVLVTAAIVVAASRPTPAQAALAEIARAAEYVDPLTISPGQYAYTRSHTMNLGVTETDPSPQRSTPIAYLIPTNREAWISQAGITHLVTTTGQPVFFNPVDEADYYAANYDELDQVGRTTTETFDNTTNILTEREWPTDPDQLRQTLTGLIHAEAERPLDVEILDIALDLIREVGPTPALRAAVVAVIAELDLTLEEESPEHTTFSITFGQPDSTTMKFTLTDEGQLTEETITDNTGDDDLDIPPGTEVESVTYQPTLITTTPPPS